MQLSELAEDNVVSLLRKLPADDLVFAPLKQILSQYLGQLLLALLSLHRACNFQLIRKIR